MGVRKYIILLVALVALAVSGCQPTCYGRRERTGPAEEPPESAQACREADTGSGDADL